MRRELRIAALLFVCLLMWAGPLMAADWPVYRHDNGRSAATTEKIAAKSLKLAWVFRSPQAPRKAWYGPAKWDAYRKIAPVGDVTRFDSVFHVIAVGGRVYYGSNADDAVHCIDAKTGKELWTFTTGGPVRLPPSFHKGTGMFGSDLLLFGSDDGYAYAIKAKDGKLIWKLSPAEGRRKIFNDGRLISRWPVRTGVTVAGDTAYFAASLLPANESYICAVDVKTGKPKRIRQTPIYKTFMGMAALEGGRLMLPQGRNGSQLHGLPGLSVSRGGTSGCLAMLVDGHFVGGPETRSIGIWDNDLNPPKKGQRHGDRFDAAYSKDNAYVLGYGGVLAQARVGWKTLWNAGGHSRSVIATGSHVFVGGIDEVRAINIKDGVVVWKAKAPGEVYGLAAANGAVYASTTDGRIYCFRPNAKGRMAKRKVSTREVAAKKKTAREEKRRKPVSVKLAAGPFLQFTSPTTATVRWVTSKRTPTILEYANGRIYRDDKPRTVHKARLTRLRPMGVFNYQVKVRIGGQPGNAPARGCESHYNYAVPTFRGAADTTKTPAGKAAEAILGLSNTDRGICFMIGAGDGQLGYEIARRTKFSVIAFEKDKDRVAAVRAAWQKTGRYGVRLTVLKVDGYDELPVPSACANLIVFGSTVDGGEFAGDPAEVSRLLRPQGGVAVVVRTTYGPMKSTRAQYAVRMRLIRARLKAWLERTSFKKRIFAQDSELWGVITRPDPLPGSGEWSHQYGKATNAAYGGEELQGATKISDLTEQWVGRPGPRFHPERQVRKPAPLVRNGRLFYQGMERLIAIDIFNGTVLWSLEIPGMRRYNMPRDGGNFCADDDFVYLAHEKHCWKINAATGRIERLFDVVTAPLLKLEQAWSHVAMAGELLIGSSVRVGSHYTNHWSRNAWFDDRIGAGTGKICSANLFAMDTQTASVKWTYNEKSAILNSSITAGGGRVYFVEMPAGKLVGEIFANHWGRLYGAHPGSRHVALDAKTGRVLWKRPFAGDVGETLFYQAYAKERLVTVSSTRGYRINAFDAATGEKKWSGGLGLARGNHGGTMQRPIIVGDTLHVDTSAFNLQTGKRGPGSPVSSCGTKAASKYALFYRYGDIQMWPAAGKKPATRVTGIRPDCWLSAVPGSGMLLAPEGGGGCSCGGGLRTSMGLIPRTDLPVFKIAPQRFLGSMQVEMEKPLGGEVHYTIDGDDPTLASAKYAGPVTLTESAVVRARAKGSSPGPELGACVWRRYEKVEPRKLATEARISFEPNDGGPKADGYLSDHCDLVGVHDNGYAYGWTDLGRNASRWNKDKDAAFDTIVYLNGPIEWRMAVKNGTYEVTLGVKAQKDHRGKMAVSGTEFALKPGEAGQKEWKSYMIKGQVEVKNGILRLGAADKNPGARGLHIAHITLRRL